MYYSIVDIIDLFNVVVYISYYVILFFGSGCNECCYIIDFISCIINGIE